MVGFRIIDTIRKFKFLGILRSMLDGSKPMGDFQPLVAVLGSTGTGKTKLAVQLAQAFDGEIISTDSLQVYKGLDISTNKATSSEMCGVPHHLIGFVDPLVTNFTVVQFRDRALSIIDDLRRRNKLPIIAGGTNYYVEALLWKILLDDFDEGDFDDGLPPELLNLSNDDVHKRLADVDAVSAAVLHPNDRKRVLRALQIWYRSGERKSDLLDKQRRLDGGSSLGAPLRFRRCVGLFLQSDSALLNARLDKRVGVMVESGLRQELTDFYDRYFNAHQATLRLDAQEDGRCEAYIRDACSLGIFQSIGLKEFLPFLQLSPEERDAAVGEEHFNSCCERLRIATRQYARRQRKWVRNRMIERQEREAPLIYPLNVDSDDWQSDVASVACDIVRNFISSKPIEQVDLRSIYLREMDANDVTVDIAYLRNRNYYCDVCQKMIKGTEPWQKHIGGAKHRAVKFKIQQKEQCTG